MSRVGLSYFDIADTAEAIKAQGFTPTVDRVYAILGTGSRTTINNHLRAWKAHKEQGPLDGSLKEKLGSIVNENAAAIYSALESQVSAKYQSLLDERTVESDKLRAELTISNQERDDLLAEIDRERAQKGELEFQLSRSRARVLELEHVTRELETKLAETKGLNISLEGMVDYLRNTVSELQVRLDATSRAMQLLQTAAEVQISRTERIEAEASETRRVSEVTMGCILKLVESQERQRTQEAQRERFRRSPSRARR